MNKLGLLLTGIAALTAGAGVYVLNRNRIDILEAEELEDDELEEESEDA